MADRYLLESGAPDGYQLEDGSGVLLLENGMFFDGMSNAPIQLPNIVKAALIASVGVVAPIRVTAPEAVTLDKWYQPNPAIVKGSPLQSYNLTAPIISAPEAVTLDKWHQFWPSPKLSRKVQQPLPIQPLFVTAPEVVTLDKWHQHWPLRTLRIRVQFQQPVLIDFSTPVAEIITPDKWLTESPYFVPAIKVQHQDQIQLEGIADVIVPPEPPKPPPEPRIEKKIVVKVHHRNRPFGGFNTIYYVDDE